MQDEEDHQEDGLGLQPMLRERELATRWGLSRRTLQRMRAAGRGPTYHIIGSAIRYRLDQVIAYEDSAARDGGPS
jgi:hypothetical protein